MKPFDAYTLYLALKNHFTNDSYDYFRYHGKVKANEDSFDSRRDNFHFLKLSKKQDPKGFLLALFSNGWESKWIGELVTSEDAQMVYDSWLKRQQSLSYIYKQELGRLHQDLHDNLFCSDEKPYLFTMLASRAVSPETVLILQDTYNFFPYWDRCMGDDVAWKTVKRRLEKYSPFFKYDLESLQKITKEHFDG